MSDTIDSLQRKISSAGDLQSVVRSMKALAASSIGQYEKSVNSLADYYRTVELGLHACLLRRKTAELPAVRSRQKASSCSVIIFGSDQGLVGQFNDVVADYAVKTLTGLPAKTAVWTVGERVHERLADAGLSLAGIFPVPNSVKSITQLVGQILVQSEKPQSQDSDSQFYLIYNRCTSGAIFETVSQQLLPLDEDWLSRLSKIQWPTKSLPEVIGESTATLRALTSEYLFVSTFRACAESLASENASRLAAMQRADKNIDDLLEDLNRTFHRLRQSSIDEELFDVVSGFEALNSQGK